MGLFMYQYICISRTINISNSKCLTIFLSLLQHFTAGSGQIQDEPQKLFQKKESVKGGFGVLGVQNVWM